MSNLLVLPEIVRKADSIFVDKRNGTRVNYYIFPEFEIHANVIEPETEQEWHHHTKIEETLFIVAGNLTAMWLEKGKFHEESLEPGDMIRVGASVHSFANHGRRPVSFLVFRYVPDGTDKHELIKNDRLPDTVEKAT